MGLHIFLPYTSYNCSLDCFFSHKLSGKEAMEGGYGDTCISKFASVMPMQTSYFPHNFLSRAVRRKKYSRNRKLEDFSHKEGG